MHKIKIPLPLLRRAFILGVTAGSVSVLAQSPSRPIRLLVPFSAGGSVDAAARILGQGLAQQLGQQVVVENRPGADGALAVQELMRAPADGSVLLFATNTAIVGVPALRLKPPYDPTTAITPLGMKGLAPFFLFVHPGVPATNVKELLTYIKANPGKLNYAAGNATGSLAFAQLARLQGLQMTSVPYKGEAPAVPDLLSGRVHLMLGSTTGLLKLAADGKLKVLAVIADKRSSLAPETPTFAEAGLGGISVSPWTGLFMPGGTPKTVVERLTTEFALVVKKPETERMIEAQALTVQTPSADEMRRFVKSQYEVWVKLVDAAGIERE